MRGLQRKGTAQRGSRKAKSSDDVTPPQEDTEAVYRGVATPTTRDGLHTLIAEKGPEFLNQGLPYVVYAARLRIRRDERRERRQQHLLRMRFRGEAAPTEGVVPQTSCWDPYERAARSELLRNLIDALARLPDADAMILWRCAEGYSDREIVARWRQFGGSEPPPSEASVRKRRERAREALRRLLPAPMLGRSHTTEGR
jgi:hypothetical protein